MYVQTYDLELIQVLYNELHTSNNSRLDLPFQSALICSTILIARYDNENLGCTGVSATSHCGSSRVTVSKLYTLVIEEDAAQMMHKMNEQRWS